MGTCILDEMPSKERRRLACSAAEIDSACATTRPGILVCLCQHKPRHAPTQNSMLLWYFLFAGRYSRTMSTRTSNSTSPAAATKRRNPRKTTLPHGSPTRTQIRNQTQQHDLHARPRWMHEWSYAEGAKSQAFRHNCGTHPLSSFVHRGVATQIHTKHDASFVRLWRRDVDLKIAVAQQP